MTAVSWHVPQGGFHLTQGKSTFTRRGTQNPPEHQNRKTTRKTKVSHRTFIHQVFLGHLLWLSRAPRASCHSPSKLFIWLLLCYRLYFHVLPPGRATDSVVWILSSQPSGSDFWAFCSEAATFSEAPPQTQGFLRNIVWEPQDKRLRGQHDAAHHC